MPERRAVMVSTHTLPATTPDKLQQGSLTRLSVAVQTDRSTLADPKAVARGELRSNTGIVAEAVSPVTGPTPGMDIKFGARHS